MAIDNQTKIDYFKEPLEGKTGYEAFKYNLTEILESHETEINNLTEILESHETEINNLETDKLEKNGYTGTAQDLKNGIDLKLDKGTYTGTAQDLKDDITGLKNQMKYYATRALAITDEASISIGDYIETIGSVSINDGLGGEYVVGNTLADTTGGWKISTGKYANRMVKNSKIYNAELTGEPTSTTPTTGDNSNKIATTAFVNAMLGVNAVPTQNLSPNGYVKMANGLIIQWGAVEINGTYKFPVAFNSIPKLVFGSVLGNNGVPRANSVTTTGFTYGSANAAHCSANYVAIGY